MVKGCRRAGSLAEYIYAGTKRTFQMFFEYMQGWGRKRRRSTGCASVPHGKAGACQKMMIRGGTTNTVYHLVHTIFLTRKRFGKRRKESDRHRRGKVSKERRRLIVSARERW